MKWPKCIIAMRHDTSTYNLLRQKKQKDPLYQKFVRMFENDPKNKKTITLATQVWKKYRLDTGDANTPLADIEAVRAMKTGRALSQKEELPDVVFVSPYARTQATWRGLIVGWPELAKVKYYEEERIREQEHGLAVIFNDWRVFHTIHPEQRQLYLLEGPYWYRYPQGENVPDMRKRNRDWTDTLIREFANKRVMAITHHLNILGIRANYERLSADDFLKIDEEQKPINCGVTKYRGIPHEGKNGRLELEYYNANFYADTKK
jgi:broad specificity phosphatase PhoE